MTQSKHTRRQFLTRTAATGAVVVGATGVGSADTGDDFPGIFGHQMEVERDYWSFFTGVFAGMRTFGPPPTTDTLAERARNEFVANQDAWLSYGNWLIDEHGGTPVDETSIGVDFTITQTGSLSTFQTGTTETIIYVDFDSDADVVEAIDWQIADASDAEYHVTLQNDAAQGAADELQSYRREWIDEGGDDHELGSNAYWNSLAGQYWSDLRFGSDAQSIVQVILGEVSI